jgi:hypothetical protein
MVEIDLGTSVFGAERSHCRVQRRLGDKREMGSSRWRLRPSEIRGKSDGDRDSNTIRRSAEIFYRKRLPGDIGSGRLEALSKIKITSPASSSATF